MFGRIKDKNKYKLIKARGNLQMILNCTNSSTSADIIEESSTNYYYCNSLENMTEGIWTNSCPSSRPSSSSSTSAMSNTRRTNPSSSGSTNLSSARSNETSTSTIQGPTSSINAKRRIINVSSSESSPISFTMKKARWSFLILSIFGLFTLINAEPPLNALNANWDRPTGMPKITQLEVMCGAQHMEVHLSFDQPFHGLVASKGMYGHQGCVYVPPRTGKSQFVFNIYYDKCGTKPDNHGKFYENTVVVQYDEELIEAWDEAKRLRCEWFNDYEKTATKTSPMVISDLDIVELNFHGDNVDCWMEIQQGKGPWAPPLNGIVPLGSPLTMVVAVKDPTGEFDMRVKACEASDGQGAHVLPLSDPEGCILRPKLLGKFSKVKLDDGRATVLTYAYISAFKFPDMLNVHLRCTVEICRHGCPDHCISKYGSPAAAANTPVQGNRLQAQHSLLEPMAHESQNVEQVVPSQNDLAFEEKPKPSSQEDLQLIHQKLPLNSGEAFGQNPQHTHLPNTEPANMQPPPMLPQNQPPRPPHGIHQFPHQQGRPFPGRPFPPQQQQVPPHIQQQQQQQQRPSVQMRPPGLPQGFPRPHPSHGHRLPPPPPPQQQQGQGQQQFPPRPFVNQGQRFPPGIPPPPPGHAIQNSRPFGGSSFEIIPSHSTEVKEEQVNPRNNNEAGNSSSSPAPEEIAAARGIEEQDEDKEREAMMAAESNNQPFKEDRQGEAAEPSSRSSEENREPVISIGNFKGPRNLRVRRSVTAFSDVIGVQGAFKVISQADLDFVLNSTSTNEFSTSSSPVLKGRMKISEEAIYGICLPKIGFSVVFFGLGLATLVSIVIAAFLAYARYRIIVRGGNNCSVNSNNNPKIAGCNVSGPISLVRTSNGTAVPAVSFVEQSFPMVILRKMW